MPEKVGAREQFAMTNLTLSEYYCAGADRERTKAEATGTYPTNTYENVYALNTEGDRP